MINIELLPREIQDRLTLMEERDSSFYRIIDNDYTNTMYEMFDERKNKRGEQSFIASVFGGQGTGKSYMAISCCAYLDEDFTSDNIYFDYNKLVYDRKNIRPHTAILMDEQMSSYGVDSVRVNIILTGLKEQLRKRGIHFFFCAPTLKEEYVSSMYVLETLFIDQEKKECVSAYRTNKLLNLGYIHVPHPLKYVNKELMKAYEEKKDKHLDGLMGKDAQDDIDDRAQMILGNKKFIEIEQIYVSKKGYVPYKMLIQMINALYPEFKSSVISYEIADRIKMKKETSGEWNIH
jgi:hypothetical protein